MLIHFYEKCLDHCPVFSSIHFCVPVTVLLLSADRAFYFLTYSLNSLRYTRYSASVTPGCVWWSTLGMKPPVFMMGRMRSNSARMAASPRVMTILS